MKLEQWVAFFFTLCVGLCVMILTLVEVIQFFEGC